MKLKSIGLAIIVAMGATTASAATISGTFWDADTPFRTIDDAIAFADSNTATAGFESTAVDYPGGSRRTTSSRRTTLADYLGDDAASLTGGGDIAVERSVFRFTGMLDLAAGTHVFRVGSDDGFRLEIGGAVVAEQVRPRGFRHTTRSFTTTGGPTEFVLTYFENYGRTGVEFRLNDVIVDAAALAPIPLPASLGGALLGIGALGIVAHRRRRNAA